MKISGLSLPDNCSLHFHANGIKVRVSLNIERKMLKYIPKGKSDRGDKFFVYWCAQDIPLRYCSSKNIELVYASLLNTAMQNMRAFKQKMLADEIEILKRRQTKITFGK